MVNNGSPQRRGSQEQYNQNGVTAFPESSQLEELQRANGVLLRAKETLFKRG